MTGCGGKGEEAGRSPAHLHLCGLGDQVDPEQGTQGVGDSVEGEFGHELPRHVRHPGGNPCHGDSGKGGSRHRGKFEAQGAKSMYLGYKPVKAANMKPEEKEPYRKIKIRYKKNKTLSPTE